MPVSRRTLLLTGGAVVALAAGAAYVVIPPEIAASSVFTVNGIAIRGTDPVAYFTDNMPVPGSAEHSHDWNGATWYFASAENRDLFAADPLVYAPQYGGFCAWAVAAKGMLYSTQPDNWAIVDGKLYMNFNDSIQMKWNADRPGFIIQGDKSWPDLQSSS